MKDVRVKIRVTVYDNGHWSVETPKSEGFVPTGTMEQFVFEAVLPVPEAKP